MYARKTGVIKTFLGVVAAVVGFGQPFLNKSYSLI